MKKLAFYALLALTGLGSCTTSHRTQAAHTPPTLHTFAKDQQRLIKPQHTVAAQPPAAHHTFLKSQHSAQ
ncbi:hypothetical protein SAMN05421823_109187 [Catalinimonas alkaloidigena]|uniref:Uncharacterized protein n=1 Tax=Catalinimonas alkaloidigena TaxID=1075417 RepID=A0A1G9PGG0_9BACT|nr:hypothetical protein [Catalinimonas alkaloidigena]SDL97858.1 hypothetical protein SAMN05421823_109187 [Catalinimonas alkaloidigena]